MDAPRFVKANLVLPVDDMKRATDWYADALGFETVFLNTDPDDDPDGNYAILRRDGATVHLILDEAPRDHPWSTAGSGYLFLTVKDVDAVFQEVQTSGADAFRGIVEEDWGTRAFQLKDPSGNLILVAEDIC